MKFLIASRIAALILLAAAGLKLVSSRATEVWNVAQFGHSDAAFYLVAAEIGLGLWLLSGVQPQVARWVGVAAFTLFAAVSGVSAWRGRVTCDCFGDVPTHPVLVCALDIVLALSLALTKPTERGSGRMARILGVAVATSVAAIVFAGHGSFQAGLARLQNYPFLAEPKPAYAYEVEPSSTQEFRVELSNNTDSPLAVTGAESSCSCTITNDLPITLPPFGQATLTVRVNLDDTPGLFYRRMTLLTDRPGVTAPVRFAGSVKKKPAGKQG